MFYRYIALFILTASLAGSLFSAPPCGAETLVQSTFETRLVVALRVGQAEVQKLVPLPLQVAPSPGGPIKDANFFLVFIDQFLVQDAQGRPDQGKIYRYLVFAVPAKHTQTGEIVTVVTGGFHPDILYLPGPYQNAAHGTIKREQRKQGTNLETGVSDDLWEVRDTRGGSIELRVQYQVSLPVRAKSEQKIYSSAEPDFFRIYRSETLTDLIKSTPAGINRVQNYNLRVFIPELKNLFDGREQLVGIAAYPLFLRRIFLP